MSFRSLPLCAVLLVALLSLVVGCGSDDGDGGSDQDDIEQVITDFANNEGASCDLLTDRLVDEQFEGREECEAEAEESKDEEDPDGIEFGEITVDGDGATAQVEVEGDPTTVRLEKVDGKWKIDELGPGETAESDTSEEPPAGGDETIFVLEEILGCLQAEGLDASRQSGLGDDEAESDHVRIDYTGGNALVYVLASAEAAAEEEETQRMVGESLGVVVRRVGNTVISEEEDTPADVTAGLDSCVADG